VPDRLRSPAARAAGTFATLIALPAIIGLLGDEPTPARVAVVLASVVVFLGLFFHAVRGRDLQPKPTPVIVRAYLAEMAIASALTVADRPEWNLLFYYAVAVAGLRLPRPWNIVAVPVTAVVAGVTATAGGANSSAAWGQALVCWGSARRWSRWARSCAPIASWSTPAPRRRDSPWPTSARASPATCTTSSAIRCRSSR
jgi:hypothetical protein